jgi:hypothetical protein
MMARRKPESGPCHDENPRGGVGAWGRTVIKTTLRGSTEIPIRLRPFAGSLVRRHADTPTRPSHGAKSSCTLDRLLDQLQGVSGYPHPRSSGKYP